MRGVNEIQAIIRFVESTILTAHLLDRVCQTLNATVSFDGNYL